MNGEQKTVAPGGGYAGAGGGGGVAGIAAALAARRAGAGKVLLIERAYALGGLATLGLIAIYLPLCDGRGRQVSFGIAEELLRLAVRHGSKDPLPDAWLGQGAPQMRTKTRFQARYDPNVFAILAEQLLLAEGVELLYGTLVCDVRRAGSRVTALVVENKAGRSAIPVRAVVDATGDADVCALAGAPTRTFAPGNPLAAWYFACEDGKLALHTLGAADVPEGERDGDEPAPLSAGRYSGLDAFGVTDMMCRSHAVLLEDFLQKGPVGPGHSLASIAALPQLRMTRCLRGAYALDENELFTHFADSVGQIASWRRPGPVYEVPFRALYSPRVTNLLAAGRCISATDAMWDLTRVIPACAVTGQAAGTAAALGRDVSTLPAQLLQEKLAAAGVPCRGDF